MKSNVSDYLEMAQLVYIDACAVCIADVSDLRDLLTIRSRVKDEGISFLTITLPKFCEDFERSLAIGRIDPTFFRSFRKNGAIPVFLQGMLGLIFDRETGGMRHGSVIDEDFASFVNCVRQICLTFKKVQLPCLPARVARSLSDFMSIEQSFQTFSILPQERDYYNLVSALLWDNPISLIKIDSLTPRHGPGATADRISGNRKYSWRRWHERLESYFPLVDNAYSMSSIPSEEIDLVTFVKPDQELPVRVTPVPKTMNGPRIIAIEPVCMQYAQQAVRNKLYATIGDFWLTKGHLNFKDQSINQQLALTSSFDGRLATIDLSEASDRVPRDLALQMFRANPDLSGLIEACRTTSAEMPGGEIISPLRKFASMGSALCFPIESMYFYTLCIAALLREQNLPVSFVNIFDVSRNVYVYGDDIIVPSTQAIAVLEYLQKYNCKVNTSKTFVTGRFRESCGVDAYAGEVVTPTYLRHPQPKDRQQVNRLLSWVATANLFYSKGFWRTSTHMFNICEEILGPLPYVSSTTAGLGRTSYLGYQSVGRWNGSLQRFEIKCWSPSPVYRTDELNGYAALQKSLLSLEARITDYPDDSSDPLHLERSALYGAVAIKRRWVPLR